MTRKIVYIDDEPMLCRAFRAVLTSVDVPVETFTDVDAALSYISSNEVAAIFCDFRMPNIGGLEVLDRLASGPAFYFVSGDIEALSELTDDPRITGFLTKPYRSAELITLVHQHLVATRA